MKKIQPRSEIISSYQYIMLKQKITFKELSLPHSNSTRTLTTNILPPKTMLLYACVQLITPIQATLVRGRGGGDAINVAVVNINS